VEEAQAGRGGSSLPTHAPDRSPWCRSRGRRGSQETACHPTQAAAHECTAATPYEHQAPSQMVQTLGPRPVAPPGCPGGQTGLQRHAAHTHSICPVPPSPNPTASPATRASTSRKTRRRAPWCARGRGHGRHATTISPAARPQRGAHRWGRRFKRCGGFPGASARARMDGLKG